MLCLLSYVFYFIGDKISAYHFKDEITPSLKAKDRLKYAHYVAMNQIREKEKPLCKLLYEWFKVKYGYNLLL